MSIRTVFNLAGVRHQQQTAPPVAAETTAPPAPRSVDSAMQRITAFIPSEIIGIYVAIVGIYAPTTSAEKWWIFGLCALLTFLFLFLSNSNAKKKNLPVPDGRRLLFLIVIVLIAYTAWAATLPSTPFLALSDRATTIGGIAVIVLAVFLPMIAEWLDVVPPSPS